MRRRFGSPGRAKEQVQPKLEVGSLGDKHEQEADAVADQVMRMPEEEEKVSMKSDEEEQVQMKPADEEEKVQMQPESEEESVQMQADEEESGSIQMKPEEEKISRAEEDEEIQMKRAGNSAPAIQRLENGKSYAVPGLANQLSSRRGLGKPLPGKVQSEMGTKMGADFSRVGIHTDSSSVQMNKELGAKAFTHGKDIYFNQGNYDPNSSDGKRLLAHELTHVVQQGGKTLVQKQDSGDELQQRLDRIEQQYRDIITDARAQGYNVAADNLQRFLDGAGGTQNISSTWLRSFGAITGAERTNQTRFENSLKSLAYELNDGETRTFTDYWDRRLTGGITTELYYASGTSTITSRGTFTLSRSGDVITITGTVSHHWWDPYDWHAGLAAFIPGHGTISDEDALLLQQHRGAAPFDMESDWQQTVSGSVEIVPYWFDSVSFTWSGP